MKTLSLLSFVLFTSLLLSSCSRENSVNNLDSTDSSRIDSTVIYSDSVLVDTTSVDSTSIDTL